SNAAREGGGDPVSAPPTPGRLRVRLPWYQQPVQVSPHDLVPGFLLRAILSRRARTESRPGPGGPASPPSQRLDVAHQPIERRQRQELALEIARPLAVRRVA